MDLREIAPPRRLRVARGRVPWRQHPFTIVHIGQSAIVLGTTGDGSEDVTVTDGVRGLVPGGVCVPDPEEFSRVRSVAVRAGVDARVGLRAWDASTFPGVVEGVDLTISPVSPDPAALAAWRSLLASVPPGPIDPVMDPAPSRALAGPLAEAALAPGVSAAPRSRTRGGVSSADQDDAAPRVRPSETMVETLLRRLVGAGPGTTPTGDDTIVGVLAALDAARGTVLAPHAVEAARSRIADGLAPLRHGTTRASRHDLAAATAGLFPERLHEIVAAMADASAVPAAAAMARTWGATSGLDLAHAVAAGLAVARATTHPDTPAVRPVSPDHRRSA